MVRPSLGIAVSICFIVSLLVSRQSARALWKINLSPFGQICPLLVIVGCPAVVIVASSTTAVRVPASGTAQLIIGGCVLFAISVNVSVQDPTLFTHGMFHGET